MAPVWPGCRPVAYAVSSLHAIGRSTPGTLVVFLVVCRPLRKLFRNNHLANGCPVRAASITCLIASTVTWACSLLHSSPEGLLLS